MAVIERMTRPLCLEKLTLLEGMLLIPCVCVTETPVGVGRLQY